jgi:hypothetical protein
MERHWLPFSSTALHEGGEGRSEIWIQQTNAFCSMLTWLLCCPAMLL